MTQDIRWKQRLDNDNRAYQAELAQRRVTTILEQYHPSFVALQTQMKQRAS
jgi:hypothetical protein